MNMGFERRPTISSTIRTTMMDSVVIMRGDRPRRGLAAGTSGADEAVVGEVVLILFSRTALMRRALSLHCHATAPTEPAACGRTRRCRAGPRAGRADGGSR